MALLSVRKGFLLGFFSTLFALGFVLFLQEQDHLSPCSLCIFQRIVVFALMGIFLFGTLHNPQKNTLKIYLGGGMIISALGLGIALRQVYLQHLPADQVPGCGPGLNFLFQEYSFLDALKAVLQGSGDCAQIQWKFLGLSLANWSAFYFLGVLGLSGWVMVSAKGKGK